MPWLNTSLTDACSSKAARGDTDRCGENAEGAVGESSCCVDLEGFVNGPTESMGLAAEGSTIQLNGWTINGVPIVRRL
jgi:hypothetical protein